MGITSILPTTSLSTKLEFVAIVLTYSPITIIATVSTYSFAIITISTCSFDTTTTSWRANIIISAKSSHIITLSTSPKPK